MLWHWPKRLRRVRHLPMARRLRLVRRTLKPEQRSVNQTQPIYTALNRTIAGQSERVNGISPPRRPLSAAALRAVPDAQDFDD